MRTIYNEVMLRLTAHIRQQGPAGAAAVEPVESVGRERYIEVSAATYDAAKQEVLDQVPAGWIVASFRVSLADESAT